MPPRDTGRLLGPIHSVSEHVFSVPGGVKGGNDDTRNCTGHIEPRPLVT